MPLWCRSITHLGFWRKQSPAEAVHVSHVHLDAGVGEAQLVEAGGIVPGTDVTLASKGRDSDGVLQLRLRQVVADPAVHVTLRTEKNNVCNYFHSTVEVSLTYNIFPHCTNVKLCHHRTGLLEHMGYCSWLLYHDNCTLRCAPNTFSKLKTQPSCQSIFRLYPCIYVCKCSCCTSDLTSGTLENERRAFLFKALKMSWNWKCQL